MRPLLLVAVTLALAGCQAHQITRSALVPAVTPPLSTGFGGDDQLVGVSLGNSTFLRASTPIQLSGSVKAGLYIPRSQWGVQADFTVVEGLTLGPKFEFGMRQGADPIARDLPPPPDAPVVSFGPTMQYSIKFAPFFRLGLGFEALWTFAPYSVYEGCSSLCRQIDSGTDTTAVISLWAIPSFKVGPVIIFGGIAGRNQPTNTRNELVYTTELFFNDDDNVTFGRMYFMALGGLQLHLKRILDLTVEIYYPVTREPVAYGGPALSAWITVPFGEGPAERRRKRAAMRPYPPYPGYYPAQPGYYPQQPGYAPQGYPPAGYPQQPGYAPPGYPQQNPSAPPAARPPQPPAPRKPAPPPPPPPPPPPGSPEEIQ